MKKPTITTLLNILGGIAGGILVCALIGIGLIVYDSEPDEVPADVLEPARPVITTTTAAPTTTLPALAEPVDGPEACLTWPLCKLQHGYCKHHCIDNPPQPCDPSGCQLKIGTRDLRLAVDMYGSEAVKKVLIDNGVFALPHQNSDVDVIVEVCKGCDNSGAFCKSLGWPACCLCHQERENHPLAVPPSPADLSACYHHCEDTIHCGSTRKTVCACSYACHYNAHDPSTWGQWCNRSGCASIEDGMTCSEVEGIESGPNVPALLDQIQNDIEKAGACASDTECSRGEISSQLADALDAERQLRNLLGQ